MEIVIKILQNIKQQKQDYIDYYGDARDLSKVKADEIKEIDKALILLERALAESSSVPQVNEFLPHVMCSTCKHWGGQGTIGLVKTTTGDNRTCMAYLFGDMDNENFKPMPDWKVTFGNLNGAKGVLETQKDFGCINHNPVFDE